MCPEPDARTDVRRLADRAEVLARWIREDYAAGDVTGAEANAVALIGVGAAVRELLGTMAAGDERVRQLIA